jgi:hypothetical protein
VVISGLSKAAEYNGCIAIVVSDLLPGGRNTVSLTDAQFENKKISVKPGNLKYEPIQIEKLSVKQLKAVLKGTGQELIPGSEAGDLRMAKSVGSCSMSGRQRIQIPQFLRCSSRGQRHTDKRLNRRK